MVVNMYKRMGSRDQDFTR